MTGSREFRPSFVGVCAICASVLILLTSCGGGQSTDNMTKLDVSAVNTSDAVKDYVIAPQDKLSIRVFQVQDLSLTGVQVDASGQIVLPLVGSVQAAGMTTNQLSKEIADKLSERYLQNPQVSVLIEDSASQRVTVEGEVKSPGVFKMSGRTTLLQALALAGGPSDTADIHDVAIIRVVNGERKAGVCDYAEIRDGKLNDPVLQGEDVVVMKGSTTRAVWAEVLKSLPVVGLFAAFG